MIDIRWVWALLDTPTADADRSGTFWATVTRSRLSPPFGRHGEFVTLEPERGDAWLALQRIENGDGGIHLDLDVDVPVAEAAAEALRLGAEELTRRDGVVILRSPAGFVFCLTTWANTGSATRQERRDQPDLLDQVCIDIPADLYAREVDFWETLTGWPKRPGSLPEFVSLTRPDGIPLRFLLQRLGKPTGTASAHLDLATLDRDATREAHVAAGARVVSAHEFWTVMQDPVGRTYCLTDRSP